MTPFQQRSKPFHECSGWRLDDLSALSNDPPAMGHDTATHSIQELLARPIVRDAEQLELSICDVLHFRLKDPASVFMLVQVLASEAQPEIPKGYADWRLDAERERRGSLLMERVDACCARHHELLPYRSLLIEKELEVWSRLSYPNPWALRFCSAALKAGKSIRIPPLGLFPTDFHRALLRKNGFSDPVETETRPGTIRIHIGEEGFLPENQQHLVTRSREARKHPLGQYPGLGCQLANGILERNLEELAASERGESESRFWMIGFRVLGPPLAFLIQEAGLHELKPAFQGIGSGLLDSLFSLAVRHWPWIGQRFDGDRPASLARIFGAGDHVLSLFPPGGTEGGNALLQMRDSFPDHLLLHPMQLLFSEAIEGRHAAAIQAGIEAFVDEYAYVACHRTIRLEARPILHHLLRFTLSPSPEWLAWLKSDSSMRSHLLASNPWTHKALVKTGPWPSASYLLAGRLRQLWLRGQLRSQTRSIEDFRQRYR